MAEASHGQRSGIGQLAAEFHLTPRTIRHYEEQGLLTPAREGVQRVYGAKDRARLSLVCRGKRLGFSLAEIKDFLDLYDFDDCQVGQMRYLMKRARERIAALERQLRDVQDTLVDLHTMVGAASDHLKRHGFADTAEGTKP